MTINDKSFPGNIQRNVNQEKSSLEECLNYLLLIIQKKFSGKLFNEHSFHGYIEEFWDLFSGKVLSTVKSSHYREVKNVLGQHIHHMQVPVGYLIF
jgi:hypothetical protein